MRGHGKTPHIARARTGAIPGRVGVRSIASAHRPRSFNDTWAPGAHEEACTCFQARPTPKTPARQHRRSPTSHRVPTVRAQKAVRISMTLRVVSSCCPTRASTSCALISAGNGSSQGSLGHWILPNSHVWTLQLPTRLGQDLVSFSTYTTMANTTYGTAARAFGGPSDRRHCRPRHSSISGSA